MSAILVPVDGSTHSLKALRIGADLAEKYGGRMVLLHVLVPGPQGRPYPGPAHCRCIAARNVPHPPQGQVAEACRSEPAKLPNEVLVAVGESVFWKTPSARVHRRGLEG